MRYLVAVIHDRAGLATAGGHAAVGVFDGRLRAEGYWVFGGGLELAAVGSGACSREVGVRPFR